MPQDIEQRWLHSHEEDTDTEMVFRPSTHDFPPSRGRFGFDLRADGTYTDIGIAPADGTIESDGTWSLDGDELTLARGAHPQKRRRLRVVSCDANRLVVAK
ncbi:MAG: hypothetical protein ACYTGZ_16990 [Planctomycetota bacterium]|jgi:hypothetical protein